MMPHHIGQAIDSDAGMGTGLPHDPGGKKRFPLQPGVRGNVDAALARPEALWQPIATLPDHIPEDDDLILAATADGRRMIWRIGLLKGNLERIAKGRQPNHLSFPAILWARLPKLPERKFI